MKSETQIRLLLIEDEEFDVRRVKNTLKYFDNRVVISHVVSNGLDAVNLLKKNNNDYDVIIMDYQIAGALRGEELIRKIKEINSTLQIIVITKLTINITDFNFAKGLMQAGAFWYCTKYPVDIEDYIYQPTDFLMSIFNAYDKRKLELQSRQSNKKLMRNVEDILEKRKIISVSESFEKLKKNILKYAESDISILISGASGTGKELVAYNIHYRSARRFENFVPINCGSIPHDLFESELFGYEKGAFTGAVAGKSGLFEIADNGTIFLDEIAELPLNAQVKLLRVIQSGEIDKIGRTKSINVNVRIIAATNKDLRKEIENGRFREDLYYRLNVVPINIPPLKERRDDIPVLLKHFVEFYCNDMGKPYLEIEQEVIDKLLIYEWPGNVRELKNLAQRLVFNSADRISMTQLHESGFSGAASFASKSNTENFFDALNIKPLKVFEKETREKYFKFVRDNSSSDADAAAKLGLAPPNYYRMSKELGLK